MANDLFRLDGRVALVTGATGGLGAGMAMGLARAGADLVLHGLTPPEDTARTIGRDTQQRVECLAADLTDRAATDRMVADAIAAMGRVDVLVNNAGTIWRAPAGEYPDEQWDTVVETNLTSVFRLCRAVGRHMLERGRGKIVNVASLLAFQGGILVPAYAASKGGVAQLTKALANEWAGRGINVNAVAPGYVRTDNTAALQADPVRSRQIVDRIPAGRWAEPGDVAGGVVFLCSSAADYVHGHVLVVDGGWMGR